MRLIDADKLIEFLDSERKSGLALHDFSMVGSYKNAINFVENMPTAYDDCCEWKQSNYHGVLYTFNVGCCNTKLCFTAKTSEKLNFCPVCGKKIKAGGKNE